MSSKFKVLIAEDDEMLRNLYEMLVRSEVTDLIEVAEDGLVAAKILSDNSDISLIISDYDMPIKNGGELYLKDIREKKIPTILISGRIINEIPNFDEFINDNVKNIYLTKPADLESLVEILKHRKKEFSESNQTLPHTQTSLNEFIKENSLTATPLKLLKRYGNDSLDVYVKVHHDRLTKIIAKENSFSLDLKTIEEYEQKGINEVYITKDAFLIITKHMVNQLTIKARQLKKVSPLDIAGLQVNVSLYNLKELGINEEQINSVNEILEETVHSIFTDRTIENKIKELMKDYSFHTSHSVLLMYVASMILKKTNLPYQKTLKKISLAAFFHDLSLNNEYVEQEHLGVNPKSDPPSNAKKRLNEHPFASAEYLNKISDDTFSEVKKIIEEHHESPDGRGYPRSLSANQISPLSALFILAHEIAINLYRNNYNKEMLTLMLKNIEPTYAQGNFKNLFEASKKAFN